MFPALYHAHHSRYVEDIPFWQRLASDAGRQVLELGCGTGRVLIPLARLGLLVVGLDRDTDMLAFLQAGLPSELRSRVKLVLADMAHFRLARRFDSILMPCNTLSTLNSQARQATFMNIGQHLAPAGIFAASLPNPQVLASLPRQGEAEEEDLFTHPLSGNPVQVSSAWERTAKFCTITWHYDQLFPDGKIERCSAAVQHSLAPLETYLRDLHQAGLEATSTLGGFDGSPYTADSENLILTARLRN